MADTRRHNDTTAAGLLAEHVTGGQPVAILQLMADGVGLLERVEGTTGQPAVCSTVVYRRLKWTTGNGDLMEATDRAVLDGLGPGDLSADHPQFWSWLPQIAAVLLPPVLTDFLTSNERPVRLLVIPTGLLSVPFDALPVGDGGDTLLERAVTAVCGSLTSAAALARPPHPGARGTVAVYDTVRLRHAGGELDAITTAYTDLTPAHSWSELHSLFTAPERPADIFAMAVHGVGHGEGWGQTKLMPDGSAVTAVDILRWHMPELCVLASCHSDIRMRRGGELAGYPLAMLLRGARAVIGSLFAIDDQATGQIMQRFWALLAAGSPAPDALRLARLNWLAEDNERWRLPARWAGLITYSCLR